MEIVNLPAGDPRWAQALPILQQLRTHMSRQDLEAVLSSPDAQRPSFFAAFDGDDCVGVCGWRLVATTSVGRKLYVDDLVTDDSARSRGIGSALLAHAEEIARRSGCAVLDLDSGVQRHGAHRFYLRERMDITSYHFVKRLEVLD
ncbi:Acetyltransferase (GNAT) family protein [Raineyella antarctica]|uniref:Acetyltransferase (GNAT) family protein n=1 Tax=Raineyella antarctica TaxID=1577474 RepID=A0A1G6HHG8_9ACTN|nr:GNAT family N-acetyltransferase [Raineyella antarctica]SDB92876.1 Acetyltransferase (GNAT) family protein [Raineyella antarctica]